MREEETWERLKNLDLTEASAVTTSTKVYQTADCITGRSGLLVKVSTHPLLSQAWM